MILSVLLLSEEVERRPFVLEETLEVREIQYLYQQEVKDSKSVAT